MTPRHFVLVTSGPIDGYPPVQYQAQLLADRGYSVDVVTPPLKVGLNQTAFDHSGVKVHVVPGDVYFSNKRIRRTLAFTKRIKAVRKRLFLADTVEIAYDPLGAFYSDLTLKKPAHRILHLHELLTFKHYSERRLKSKAKCYRRVIIPDKERGVNFSQSLALLGDPLVIPNYPLKAEVPLSRAERKERSRFEIVYCGSLGLSQKLDAVIQSIPQWPQEADLVLIGDDNTKTALYLKNLGAELGVQDRIHFLGWIDTPNAELRFAQADLGIALLDSNYENLRTALGACNKRYQYMKAGLPQIGDTNPGVRELLEDNNIGRCIPSYNPTDISAAVRFYFENPSACHSEGSSAFSLHQSKYNYERVFERLIDEVESW